MIVECEASLIPPLTGLETPASPMTFKPWCSSYGKAVGLPRPWAVLKSSGLLKGAAQAPFLVRVQPSDRSMGVGALPCFTFEFGDELCVLLSFVLR